jgi:hypothetical protein
VNNNDIFKKLRVALQLRDDEIVSILELAEFRISKGEIGNFFRSEDHPKYVECGDQILRNFLNGLVIHLRGTRDNPKAPRQVLKENKPAPAPKKAMPAKPSAPKQKHNVHPVEKTSFKNGKPKKS